MNAFSVLFSFCALFFSFSAIALPSQQLTPGGVAVVEIGPAKDSLPNITFNKRRVTITEENGKYFALVGIPLSAKIGRHTLKDSQSDQTWSFTIQDKKYAESRVNGVAKDKVNPSKESLDRIAKERPLKWKAKNIYTENVNPNVAFVLPIKKENMKHEGDARFSTPYGKKRFFNDQPRSPHRGMDIRGGEGTPIYAPADGVVTQAQDFFFSGNCVFLDHGRGLVSLYAHMSKINVEPGQVVKQGDLLGLVGSTGRVSGPHLHWSIGLNGEWIDPALFVPETDRPTNH